VIVEKVYHPKGPCVYLLQEPDSPFYKAGRASNLSERLHGLNGGRVDPLIFVNAVACPTYEASVAMERYIHEFLAPFNVSREWFRLADPNLWIQAVNNARTRFESEPAKEIKLKERLQKRKRKAPAIETSLILEPVEPELIDPVDAVLAVIPHRRIQRLEKFLRTTLITYK